MHFSSCIFPFILTAMLSLSSVQCKVSNLTPFGKKVKSIIPKEVYNKNFNQNYTYIEDVMETEMTLLPKFNEKLSTKVDPRLVKLGIEAITRALETRQEGALFQAYTSTMSDILTKLRKLNSSNVDQLAEDYVEALKKSAAEVPDDYCICDTLPALVSAQALFLKGEGITSEDDVKLFVNSLIQQLDKAAMAAPDDVRHDSIVYNLPVNLTKNVYILKRNPGLLRTLVYYIKSLFQ